MEIIYYEKEFARLKKLIYPEGSPHPSERHGRAGSRKERREKHKDKQKKRVDYPSDRVIRAGSPRRFLSGEG